MHWCAAYPNTSNIRDIPVTSKEYYPMHYEGASKIFRNTWARDVLNRTYDFIIVDEYQDCIMEQHLIFEEINKTVPVIVFGDPLQAIFGWAGKLVSWDDLCFERVAVETYPWRWEKTNPALGEYLKAIRSVLIPGLNQERVKFEICPIENCVQVMSTSCKRNLSILNLVRDYQSVLYITKWPKEQSAFCASTGGIFQNDEPQGLNYLYEVSEQFDIGNGIISARVLMDFLENSTTKINQELGSYKKRIFDGNSNFSGLRKHREFGNLLSKLIENYSIDNITCILKWISNNTVFKIYRKELFRELYRALQYAKNNNISILESSQKIRMQPELQRKYSGFKMLSSRTVLSKGLEFECVIVDLTKSLSVTDFYVAMTRATKQIILVTDAKEIMLDAPKL